MAAKKKAAKRTRRALESKLVRGKQQGRQQRGRAAPRAVAVKKAGGARGSQLPIGKRPGGSRAVGGKGSVPKSRGMTVSRKAGRGPAAKRNGGG